MGNIILYYIRGISRTDTPVFSTYAEQYTFFTSYSNAYQISDNSFYVPKFKDEINIAVKDLNFNSNYNYLSLDFLNKRYYYFIESIEYISEDVITLRISMDVIQTYMFDIQFNHSEITRDSIKRWLEVYPGGPKTINRNYERENIGNGIFRAFQYSYSAPDYFALIIHIMPTNQRYWWQYDTLAIMEDFHGNEYTTILTSDGKRTLEAGLYLILPISKSNLATTYVADNNTVVMPVLQNELFRRMIELDYVLSINIISGKFLSSMGITYNAQTNTFTYTNSQHNTTFIRIRYGASPDQAPSAECAGFITSVGPNTSITIPEFNDTRNLGFQFDGSASSLFKYDNCPQLIDENYIQVLYGEPSYMTGYPVSVLSDTYLVSYASCDLVNNVRVYSFAKSPSDYYFTIKYATSPELITLYNNPYKEYLSRNQATLSAGRALALFNNVYSGIETSAKTGSIGAGALDAVVGEVKFEADRAIKLANLKFTPDSTKVNGTGAYDFLMGNIEPRFIESIVSNITQCAEYFESYGYKVHEITTDNLFTRHKRYYYDYIQTGDMNFTLSILTDDETVNKIKERFNEGIRLWHTTDAHFDRPTGVTLYMGQLCKYNNAEVY